MPGVPAVGRKLSLLTPACQLGKAVQARQVLTHRGPSYMQHRCARCLFVLAHTDTHKDRRRGLMTLDNTCEGQEVQLQAAHTEKKTGQQTQIPETAAEAAADEADDGASTSFLPTLSLPLRLCFSPPSVGCATAASARASLYVFGDPLRLRRVGAAAAAPASSGVYTKLYRSRSHCRCTESLDDATRTADRRMHLKDGSTPAEAKRSSKSSKDSAGIVPNGPTPMQSIKILALVRTDNFSDARLFKLQLQRAAVWQR